MRELDKLRAAIEAVRAIHKPEPTGRTEYAANAEGNVTGTAPTFICASRCDTRYFFEGDGCETWLALDGAPEPDRESQLERAARELNSFGWTCHGGTHEPGDYDSCEDCQTVCFEVARAAFHAMSGTPHLSADQVWAIAKAEHDYATDTDNVPAFVMPLVDGLRAAGVAFDEQPFIDGGLLLPVEGESKS